MVGDAECCGGEGAGSFGFHTRLIGFNAGGMDDTLPRLQTSMLLTDQKAGARKSPY